jgi:hypothetical protein
MSQDYKTTSQKIQDFSQEVEDQELVRIVKLSQKNVAIAVLLGVFFPFLAYCYTRRFMPLLCFCLGIFVLALAVYDEKDPNPDNTIAGMGVIAAVAASTDNGIAIGRAKQRLQDLSR